MSLIDLFEAAFDLQENGPFIVPFPTVEADLARHVAHDQVVSTTPIDVFYRPVFQVRASADMA